MLHYDKVSVKNVCYDEVPVNWMASQTSLSLWCGGTVLTLQKTYGPQLRKKKKFRLTLNIDRRYQSFFFYFYFSIAFLLLRFGSCVQG